MKRLIVFALVAVFCLGAISLWAENQKEPEKKPVASGAARLFI